MCPIELVERNPDAVAYYLLPPRWVGATPEWAEPGQPQSKPRPLDLGELVVERDLPVGVRCRLFRDGEIAFVLGDRAPSRDSDFQGWLYYGVRLMNAHLACLHAAAPPVFTADVVTPWKVMQVEFASGDLTSVNPLDDLSTSSLNLARRPHSEPTGGVVDLRYFRVAPTVTSDTAERSLDLFRALLECPGRDAILLRAELLVRAKVGVENDFSDALTNAWTAAE